MAESAAYDAAARARNAMRCRRPGWDVSLAWGWRVCAPLGAGSGEGWPARRMRKRRTTATSQPGRFLTCAKSSTNASTRSRADAAKRDWMPRGEIEATHVMRSRMRRHSGRSMWAILAADSGERAEAGASSVGSERAEGKIQGSHRAGDHCVPETSASMASPSVRKCPTRAARRAATRRRSFFAFKTRTRAARRAMHSSMEKDVEGGGSAPRRRAAERRRLARPPVETAPREAASGESASKAGM